MLEIIGFKQTVPFSIKRVRRQNWTQVAQARLPANKFDAVDVKKQILSNCD